MYVYVSRVVVLVGVGRSPPLPFSRPSFTRISEFLLLPHLRLLHAGLVVLAGFLHRWWPDCMEQLFSDYDTTTTSALGWHCANYYFANRTFRPFHSIPADATTTSNNGATIEGGLNCWPPPLSYLPTYLLHHRPAINQHTRIRSINSICTADWDLSKDIAPQV